ncbi:hypothetical protein [Mucilaginibacter antarcticus]|uniref:Histone H1/5 n=1 Tax=Mucilaginibacter antarcticus TaxID=1855725 RepID=A0ABW5XSS9_9SPHI
MKKSKTDNLAKKATKAANKDLTKRIAAQIKAAIADLVPELKKAEKSIEKAAKTLAKKFAKLTKNEPAKVAPVKSSAAKKATDIVAQTTKAIESKPIKAMPATKPTAKPIAKPVTAKAPVAKVEEPKK